MYIFYFFSATSSSPHVTVTPSPHKKLSLNAKIVEVLFLNELKQSISYQLLFTSEGNCYKTMNWTNEEYEDKNISYSAVPKSNCNSEGYFWRSIKRATAKINIKSK